ncbi:MAG: M23 family metallopeptidase [Clostridia bacterium]|nr:M23 family metallopeptidase [Clostridia bacterium]
MMKKLIAAVLVFASLFVAFGAFAEETAAQEETLPDGVVSAWRWFVGSNKVVRDRKVTYYDNVYAYNHGNWGLTPFAYDVPAEYFVKDEEGAFALAPIVLDITDAMRERLYGGDEGETILYYGQYCDRIRGNGGKTGFSGIHEGIDFKSEAGVPLFAILGGEVTRAGDSNGTVGIYNAEYDVTLLYLHCEEIAVRRGDMVEAGQAIAVEGKKGAGAAYTHVEMREGRRTSSNKYRDTALESQCPYPVMHKALSVVESGRQPQTAAAVAKAQRMREEAEAAARAEAEKAAAEAAAAEQAAVEEAIELVDELPGAKEGYGFAQEDEAEAEEAVVPEATLPPSNP